MNKTERLGLVLTEQEKSWVINLAELEGGLTQAALIRRLIYNAAKEYGFTNDLRRQLAAKDARIAELERSHQALVEHHRDDHHHNWTGIGEPEELSDE